MASLAEEYPYAAAVVSEKLRSVCSKCFAKKGDRPLYRCSRCKVLHYCDSSCQRDDWLDHKVECAGLVRVAPRVPTSMARLLGRIIVRDKRNDESPTFNGRTLKDLVDHVVDIRKDPERADFFASLAHVLYDFLGREVLPPVPQILSFFGKVVVNCFCISDEHSETLGEALYVGLSGHDHSCSPDVFVIFQGARAILRSPTNTTKYDRRLRVSYVDLMELNRVRQADLLRQYYFLCDCRVCTDSNRDAVAESVRCSHCRGGYCPLLPGIDEALVCTLCGSPSSHTKSEAQTVNQSLRWLLQRTAKLRSGTDVTEIEEESRVLDEAARGSRALLSELNVHAALLASRILLFAFDLHRLDLLEHYAFVGIEAYKHFLPDGHPCLTLRLLEGAVASATAGVFTHVGLNYLLQAQEAALLSHGPRHPLTAQIDSTLSAYRARVPS